MVSLNININNRTFIVFGILFLIVIVGGIVVAYNSNPPNPAVFGHSVSEIEGLALSCITVENNCSISGTTNAPFCSAECPTGYTMTGGGFNSYFGTNVDTSSPGIYYLNHSAFNSAQTPGTSCYDSGLTSGVGGVNHWYECFLNSKNAWVFQDWSAFGKTTILHAYARCCKIG